MMVAQGPEPSFLGQRRHLEALLSEPRLATEVRADAHYVLWELCQACGDPAAAADHLDRAMRITPIRTRLATDAVPCRSVLLLAAPGDFQANIPIDLLLDGQSALHTLRIRDPVSVLADPASALRECLLPPIDCVMIVIAEAAERRAHLRAADALASHLGRPVLNCGDRIARLSRVGAATLLADLEDAVVPRPATLHRAALDATGPATPFLLRPSTSHAGRGLHRIETATQLRAALASDGDTDLFVATPFIDYRSADGLYRKYRFVFVDGAPFPVHLAIHDDWAVWYYNARMERFAARREEEAAFLDDPDGALPSRARGALRLIAERVRLDYFGLDCAILRDGRLLVFEIETGMVVHDRDSPDLFPAKPRVARRIAAALADLIDRRIASSTIP